MFSERYDVSRVSRVLADHALLHMKNVATTCHNTFNIREALRRIPDTIRENVAAYTGGESLNTVAQRGAALRLCWRRPRRGPSLRYPRSRQSWPLGPCPRNAPHGGAQRGGQAGLRGIEPLGSVGDPTVGFGQC
jgi:hypothetical protein